MCVLLGVAEGVGARAGQNPLSHGEAARGGGQQRLAPGAGPGWDPAATPAATLAEISAGTPATTRLRSQLRPRPRPRPQLQPRPWPQPRLRPPPRPGCPQAASLEVFWHFQSGLSAPRCFRCGRLCRPTSWASCIPQDSLPPLPSFLCSGQQTLWVTRRPDGVSCTVHSVRGCTRRERRDLSPHSPRPH